MINRSSSVRNAYYQQQGGICPLCGKSMHPLDNLHLDHIHPVARGGLHVGWNLQLTHSLCNLAKGAKV